MCVGDGGGGIFCMGFEVLQDDGRSWHGAGAILLREGAGPGDMWTKESPGWWHKFQKLQRVHTAYLRDSHLECVVRLVNGAGCQAAKMKYPDSLLQRVRTH